MNKTILIVTDKEELCTKTIDCLAADGYECVQSSDAKEALEFFEDYSPYLLIYAFNTPNLTAIDFLKLIKPDFSSNFSALIISENTSDNDLTRCYQLGAAAILPSTYHPTELRTLARKLYNHELQKKELQKHRLFLEELVEERTKELMLEEAERHKSDNSIIQLTKAIETIRLGITITDLNGTIIYANPAEASMHQLVVEEMIGQDIGILAPTQLRRPRTIEEIKKQRGSVRESINTRANGSTFPVQLVSDLIEDENDVPLGFVTICEDITSKKKSEEELINQYEFLQKLIDEIPNPVFYKNIHGVFIGCNKEFERSLKKTKEEIIGKTVFDLFPDDIAMSVHSREKEILHQQIMTQFESKFLYLDVLEHDVIFNETVFNNKEGYVEGLIGVIIDITERKQALREAEEARLAAEKANVEKSRFLSRMSHEIKNPLSNILDKTKLLSYSKLDEEQKNYTDNIKISGETLLLLINDILDLSKIEAGMLELKHETFCLYTCVEECVDLLISKAAVKNVDLSYYIDPLIPDLLCGDAERLLQILLNLVSNAIKYTDAGSVHINVSATKTEDKRHNYLFTIKDTGRGVPQELRNSLFKESVKSSKDADSTGLGLAICRYLVKQMDGQIWLDSKENIGSTFYFSICLASKENTDNHYILKANNPVLKHKRILIIGDNPSAQKVIYNYTKHWGMYASIISADQCNAETLTASGEFDLIFIVTPLDVNKCVEAIKTHYDANFPIIFVAEDISNKRVAMHYNIQKALKIKKLYNALLITLGTDIINWEILEFQRQELGFDFVDKLQEYLESIPLLVHELKENAANTNVVNNLVREIRESSRLIAVTAVESICSQIMKSKNIKQTESLIRQLETAYYNSVSMLKDKFEL